MLVADHSGRLVIPVPPQRMPLSDRRNVAMKVVDAGDPSSAALAAFYSIGAGDVDAGRQLLPANGSWARQVREFYRSQGVLE